MKPGLARAGRAALALLPWALVVALAVWKQRAAAEEVDPSLLGRPGKLYVLGTVGAALAVLAPAALLKAHRLRVAAAALVTGVVGFFWLSNLLAYRQFGDMASVALLRFSHQLGSVWGSVEALARPADALLFADALLLAALAAAPGLASRALPRPPAVLAALACAAGVGLCAFAAAKSPRLALRYVGNSQIVGDVGLLVFQAADAYAYGERLLAPKGAPPERLAELRAALDRRRAQPGPLFGAARGKGLVVIQLESLQDFVLGLEVDGQPVAPNLTRLAGESLRFRAFHHQTAQGATSDADLLANCSLFPTRTGAVYFDHAQNDFRCLPELLRERGYRTAAYQGMRPDYWNLGAVYPRVGFQRYVSLKELALDETVGLGLSDRSFVRQVLPRLAEDPARSYAFVVTLSCHHPFDFPELPRTLRLGALEGTRLGAYLQSVRYADEAVGALVEGLRASGALDEVVLAAYGDHQGLTRAGSNLADLLPLAPDDEAGWFLAEKRVPLLVRLPGGAHAGEVHDPGGQVDLAPTLAGLLGLDLGETAFLGRDLLAGAPGEVAFPQGAALDREHLFLPGGDLGRCYHLPDRAPADVAACAALRERADEALRVSWEIVGLDLAPALAGAAPR